MISKLCDRIGRTIIGLCLVVNLVDAEVPKKTDGDDYWFSHSLMAIEEGSSHEVIDLKGSSPQILNKKGKKSAVHPTTPRPRC